MALTVEELDATNMRGRVALITGAAQGIGQATAHLLAHHGADIGVLDLAAAAATRALVEAEGRRFVARRVDVSSIPAVQAAVTDVAAELGQIDVVINVAGFPDRARPSDPTTTIETLTEELWSRAVDVNLKGAVFVTQACYPHLRAAGRGSVVNISSVSAFGSGLRSGPAYAAAKAGLIGFTRVLAKHEGQHGIRANVIAPGPTQTSLTTGGSYATSRQAISRMGRPIEIAQAILFLASDQSSYVTGQVLTVDGGHVAAGSSIVDLKPPPSAG